MHSINNQQHLSPPVQQTNFLQKPRNNQICQTTQPQQPTSLQSQSQSLPIVGSSDVNPNLVSRVSPLSMNTECLNSIAGNRKSHHAIHPHPYNNNNHQQDLPHPNNMPTKSTSPNIINGTCDDMDTSPSPPMGLGPLLSTNNQSCSSSTSTANTLPLLSQGNLPILSPFVTNDLTHPTTTKSQSGPTKSSSPHSTLDICLDTSSINPMIMMHMPSINCSTTSVSCRVKVEPMENSASSPPLSEGSGSGHSSFNGPNHSPDLSTIALVANSASSSCYGTL